MDLIKEKLQRAVCFSWIHFLLKWGQMSSSKIHRQGRWKFKIIYNNYAYLMWGGGGGGGGGEQFPSWALGGGGGGGEALHTYLHPCLIVFFSLAMAFPPSQ